MRFGSDFSYKGLDNYDEVLAAATKSMDALNDVRRANGSQPIDPKVKAAILDRKVIESTFPKEALLYLSDRNLPVRRGASAQYDVELPGVFGGRVVPAQVKIKLAADVDENGRIALESETAMNFEAFAKSMQEGVGNVPGGKPLTEEDVAAMRDAKYSLRVTHQIDPATGLSAHSTQETCVELNDVKNVESYEWTVIEDKK